MLIDRDHHKFLSESYDSVGNIVNEREDFKRSELKSSVAFFEKDSLELNNPIPRNVDVFAILSGISFEKSFLRLVEKIYSRLRKILENKIFYMVQPENLGVEYAILKWPSDTMDPTILDKSIELLREYKTSQFYLNVFGIQLHTDGCIILKCIDEKRTIFNIRKSLVENLENIPNKQSNWSHIPIGRVLAPIGADNMSKLKILIAEINNELNYDILIDSVHIVHERKWYMENKDYLYTKKLK